MSWSKKPIISIENGGLGNLVLSQTFSKTVFFAKNQPIYYI